MTSWSCRSFRTVHSFASVCSGRGVTNQHSPIGTFVHLRLLKSRCQHCQHCLVGHPSITSLDKEPCCSLPNSAIGSTVLDFLPRLLYYTYTIRTFYCFSSSFPVHGSGLPGDSYCLPRNTSSRINCIGLLQDPSQDWVCQAESI